MNKRYIFSSLAILIMFGTLIYLQFKPSSLTTQETWTPGKQREYANKLKAEGLQEEAIQAYEKYLQMAQPEPEIQANIYYTIAKMAEDLGKYEKALAFLYKAQIACPESKLQADLGVHIVRCLEAMGRGLDAQSKLHAHTALEPAEKAKGKVLARIGKKVITEQKLNQELQKLPQGMQKEYQDPEKKREFLKHYLAIELLARKARRLGYDKDPEIRQKVVDIKKELIVEKLLKDEIEKKVDITPDQLELYYKANMNKYVEAEKQLSFEEVKDKVSSEYQRERQQAVYQELLEDTLMAEKVEIYE